MGDIGQPLREVEAYRQRVIDAVEAHFLECVQMTPSCLVPMIEAVPLHDDAAATPPRRTRR